MRDLLRCRRGSVAFATVVALIPLLGAIALGAEAGSWYVTKQHAQNAADAAAYSGAIRVACSLSGDSGCDTAQDYIWRGKQFAAQQSFCNAGDTTAYPGARCLTNAAGTSQSVQVDRGTYAGGAWSSSGSGSYVRVVASQQQPAYMAVVLGMSSLNITATAIAKVQNSTNPCVLALGGPITFQDNGVSINAPSCGLASNYTGPGPSIDFGPVKPSNINIGLGSVAGGCAGDPTLCQKVSTYSAPVTNPYTALDAAISALTLRDCTGADGTPPVAYTAAHNCANKNFSINGSASATLSGTYFFSGTDFTMKGASSNFTTGANGATLILLPGVTTGKSNHITITLAAPTTPPTVLPASLLPYAALIGTTAIYNTETDAQKFTGSTNFTINNGVMYYPNQALTFSGNSSLNLNNCSELIAKSVKFAGSTNFTQATCPDSAKPTSLLVRLVQ